MPTNQRLSALIVIFAALAAPAWAAKKPKTPPAPPPPAAPAAPERVTTVEGITEYRLANGLRVLLFPDQTKQTLTVNVTYLVGSRHENYGETGMAHLLEHMVFKGSTNHKDIPNELSSHGSRPNGTTSWDRTNYFETFSATEENLRWALDLESDRMVNSFIAKKDLDSEMTVVRNEYEGGENQPVSVMFKRLLSVAYDWHNYANTPIGARSDIEGVPIERLQAFYRTYYQPDNAIAARRREVRRSSHAGDGQRVFRKDCASRARAARDCTRSSRRRTASARWSCAASVTCSGAARRITSLPVRMTTARRFRSSTKCSATRRRAACTRPSWNPARRPPFSRPACRSMTRAWRASSRRCAMASRSSRCSRSSSPLPRSLRRRRSPTKKWSARAPRSSRRSSSR